MNRLGAISSYNDAKKQFDEQYHRPYLAQMTVKKCGQQETFEPQAAENLVG
jgi:hypothetical protein